MAITHVGPRWQDRKGTTNEDGTRTLARAWNVTTDSDADGEPEVIDGVIAADATAALYQAHPNWAWAVCRKIEATPNLGPRQWIVKADYSTAPFKANGDGSGGAGGGTSPNLAQSMDAEADARPPTIKITRKEVTKVLEKDAVSGARVTNTVGDPFDPLPDVFRSHHVITFTFHRKPADLNWATRAAFMDTINSAAHTILGRNYPAKSLRCTGYDVSSVWDKGAAGMELFFELVVTMEYDPDTWAVKILNRGRRQWIAGSVGEPELNPPRLEYIRDHTGQVVQEPVPLTEAGAPVPAVEPPAVPDYHYVEPAGYVPTSWANILA